MTSLGIQPLPGIGTEERSQPAKRSHRSRLLLALVFVLSALYMAQELKRGWVPSDEGTLAESAERVLHGELPHRDFHEVYTGGLSYLNAGAFRMFGTNLASMRYMLFMFSLVWIPAFYYAASQVCFGTDGCRHNPAGGGMERTELCCRHAVLVQLIFRNLRSCRTLALHRGADTDDGY